MKRKIFALSLSIVLAIACVACSVRESAPSYATKSSYDNGYYYETTEANMAGSTAYAEDGVRMTSSSNGTIGEQVPQEVSRKLIRDASLTIETKSFDVMIPELQSRIVSFGGYIESMNESGNSYQNTSYRRAYFTARIPADQLDAFLEQVDGIGNVTNKSLSTRDVTSAYVDVESRLKVLETEKESLERIMAAAETTADMLETQSRLYDVIEEIEVYEAQKRTFDSLISYSTVTISVQEVLELTPAKEETRWEELGRRFTASLADLWEAIIDFCIGFIVALPWLLVIGLVGGVIALAIVLPIRAKAKKRKAANQK